MTVDKALELMDQNLAKVSMPKEAHIVVAEILRAIKTEHEKDQAKEKKDEQKVES